MKLNNHRKSIRLPLFFPAQNSPILIGVVYLGLRGYSRWSLGSIWACSRTVGLEVKKCSKKAQTLPKNHLEYNLKPRWTTPI